MSDHSIGTRHLSCYKPILQELVFFVSRTISSNLRVPSSILVLFYKPLSSPPPLNVYTTTASTTTTIYDNDNTPTIYDERNITFLPGSSVHSFKPKSPICVIRRGPVPSRPVCRFEPWMYDLLLQSHHSGPMHYPN